MCEPITEMAHTLIKIKDVMLIIKNKLENCLDSKEDVQKTFVHLLADIDYVGPDNAVELRQEVSDMQKSFTNCIDQLQTELIKRESAVRHICEMIYTREYTSRDLFNQLTKFSDDEYWQDTGELIYTNLVPTLDSDNNIIFGLCSRLVKYNYKQFLDPFRKLRYDVYNHQGSYEIMIKYLSLPNTARQDYGRGVGIIDIIRPLKEGIVVSIDNGTIFVYDDNFKLMKTIHENQIEGITDILYSEWASLAELIK